MRNWWLTLCVLCVIFTNVKAQFTDDFSDLNFSQNPTWVGQDTNFVIDTANQQLRLLAPAVTGSSILATNSKAIQNAVWEFKLKLDFNPSGSNLARVYLVSDVVDFTGNGYFVMVGNTQDEVSLYRQSGTTISKIIDGIDGRVNLTAPELFVRVTRDSLSNWELFSDTSLTNNYTSEGSVVDSTYTKSSFFGVRCIYTSTRSDKFYFDDFNVSGTAILDSKPPVFDSLKVLSQNSLQLYFNEYLDSSNASNLSNYLVSNGVGNPSTITLSNQNRTVNLGFANAFPANQNINISINNLTDTSGNSMIPVVKPFTYFQFDSPNFRDVVINEFMADPSPPNNLPEKEFIELWNYSNKTFDLTGWQIGDNSNLRTMPNAILNPFQFLIICNQNDTLDFMPFGDVLGISSLPSLNNTADQIRLKTATNFVVDSIEYDDNWYGNDSKNDGGFTLELISPKDPCKTDEQNYIASSSPDGGTPGALNAVFDTIPDTAGPKITSFKIGGEDTLFVSFNVSLDSNSIYNASYNAGGLTFQVFSVNVPQNNLVTLLSTPKIQRGIIYNLPISGLADCYDMTMKDTSINFGIGKNPQAYEIVINEIYSIPDATISPNLPEIEFVEIYNTTNQLMSLNGLKFSDASTIEVLPDAVLQANEYAILVKNSDSPDFLKYGKVVPLNNFPSLNNTGDVLSLRNAEGKLIHQVNYLDDWFDDETKANGGFTLEQKDPTNPCGGSVNWGASVDVSGGTPGRENSINSSVVDENLPEVVSINAIDETTLWVTFNETLDSALSVLAFAEITPSILVDSFEVMNQNTLVLKLGENLETKTVYTLTINDVYDCAGNNSGEISAQFGLPELAQKNDIIINEVLFNPRRSTGTDFVEIRNNSAKYINLQSWKLANWDDENDTIGSVYIITENPLTVFPNSYLAISKSNLELEEEYTFTNQGNLFEVETLPSYPNDQGSVLILSDLDSIFDRFDYSEDYHLPFIDDNNGVSLERISSTRPTNESTNWTSAAEPDNFASPGYENAASESDLTPEDVLAVYPEIFSPDFDGYNDVLNVTYNLPSNGYAGSVKIYSPKGIEVFELVTNYSFGKTGVLSWDGRNSNGVKAEIGIYLVVMEVYNTNGETKVYKTTCTLGGKL